MVKQTPFALIIVLFLLVRILAAETFTLGAEDQAGPWGRSDGTGCGNDIVRAAFRAAGDSVVLNILPYVRAKKMTMGGELSGCFSMSREPEFKGKILFAINPLYNVQVILLVKHSAKTTIHGLCDLSDKNSIGLVKDYEYPPEVRDVYKRGVRIEETASEVQNLKKLAAGRIDAAVVCCDPLKSFSLLLKQSGAGHNIDSVSIVGVQGSFVGFSIKNSCGLRAKAQFDKGMELILTNKTCDSIVNTWRNTLPEKGGK